MISVDSSDQRNGVRLRLFPLVLLLPRFDGCQYRLAFSPAQGIFVEVKLWLKLKSKKVCIEQTAQTFSHT